VSAITLLCEQYWTEPQHSHNKLTGLIRKGVLDVLMTSREPIAIPYKQFDLAVDSTQLGAQNDALFNRLLISPRGALS
jgi:hypothetical protein